MNTEAKQITGGMRALVGVTEITPKLDRFDLNDAGMLTDYELFMLERYAQGTGCEVELRFAA